MSHGAPSRVEVSVLRIVFRADPRNTRHQKYCCAAACRKASKAASRRAWLAKPENLDYFRGPENVLRAQVWRAARRAVVPAAPVALQNLCISGATRVSSIDSVTNPSASRVRLLANQRPRSGSGFVKLLFLRIAWIVVVVVAPGDVLADATEAQTVVAEAHRQHLLRLENTAAGAPSRVRALSRTGWQASGRLLLAARRMADREEKEQDFFRRTKNAYDFVSQCRHGNDHQPSFQSICARDRDFER